MLKLLPPTEHTVLLHLQRAALATIIDKTAHGAKPQIPPFVDYGWALEDGKLVPVLSTQPAWPQLQRPLHVAAPKTATRTVPVPGRTWPVTLDVVASDQPPSAAE